MFVLGKLVLVTFFSFISTEREESNQVTIRKKAKGWIRKPSRDAILYVSSMLSTTKEGKKRKRTLRWSGFHPETRDLFEDFLLKQKTFLRERSSSLSPTGKRVAFLFGHFFFFRRYKKEKVTKKNIF